MRWTASSLQVLFYFICSFVLLMASVPEETSSYLIKSMSAYIIKESRLVENCLLFYYTHFRSIVLKRSQGYSQNFTNIKVIYCRKDVEWNCRTKI